MVAPPQGGTPALPVQGQPQPMQPGEYSPGSVANITTFGFDKVSPPSSLYVQRDDQLLLYGITNQPNEFVTFTGRFLRVPEPSGGQPSDGGVGRTPGSISSYGIVEPFSKILLLPALRLGTIVAVQLAEGYLLSLSASAQIAVGRGQTFVRAMLVRGAQSVLASGQVLLSDYSMFNGPVSWPGGKQSQPSESAGNLSSTLVGNPAAGLDWTFTVPAATRIRLQSIFAILTAANAGVPRAVEIIVTDGANTIARIAANATQAINTVGSYTIGPLGNPNTTVTTDLQVNIPSGLILGPGWQIKSNTVNVNVADQWSGINVGFEQWLENA